MPFLNYAHLSHRFLDACSTQFFCIEMILAIFQPPVPAEDWQNVFDATEEGPSCPQPDGQLTSEDCLRLNVYTTKVSS